MKRRILSKLVIREISGVDKSCQEGADVVLLKRAPSTRQERRADIMAKADEALGKFNPHHSPDDGRFTSGPGGSGSSSPGRPEEPSTSTPSHEAPAAVTPAARDKTLRWAQTALRTVKIAGWAVAAVPMVAAFVAALPVGLGFAVTTALGVLVSRAALTSTAAFLAFDQTLSALIRHREAELNKAAPKDDPVLATLRALQAELRANRGKLTNTEDTAMKTEDNDTAKSGYGESFDAHVAAAIAKGYPATVAGSLVLQQFGSDPPSLAAMRKSRASAGNFMSEVDKLLAKGCSRQEAMRRVRRECPDAYREFTEG